MTDKFIKKYMRFAKLVGSDQNPCLSRGIGTVIVNPKTNTIKGTGYNGPPKNTPHLDSYEVLKEFVYPQLTDKDKAYIESNFPRKHSLIPNGPILECTNSAEIFANTFEGCQKCPRRLVGAKSGERLDLCGCNHSERNALLNAACDLTGCYLFAYCGVPCLECTGEIINANIVHVYCLTDEVNDREHVYEFWRSEWRFKKAGVKLIKLSPKWIEID